MPSTASSPVPSGWIAIDFDGTLVRYDERYGTSRIGAAIESTVIRLQQWLDMGIEVRVFTARATAPELVPPVQDWLEQHGLPRLAVTHRRDYDLMQVWDDRAIQVETNTGELLTPKQYITLDISGWIGVELDGTLAHHTPEQSRERIGDAVSKMRMRVQQWLMAGIDVRLFTARANSPEQLPLIEAWLREHKLDKMKITCEKDFAMSQFWDDRSIHVVHNTGEIAAKFETLALSRKYS